MNADVIAAAQYVEQYTQVPYEIIASQWAYEQPHGVEHPEDFNFNIAGLTKTGTPGDWREYDSIMDFATDYVFSFLLKGYPGAIGAKDPDTFAAGLKNGVYGSYFGGLDTDTYATGIKSRYEQNFGPFSEQQPNGSGEIPAAWEGVPGAAEAIEKGGTIAPAEEKKGFAKIKSGLEKLQRNVKYGKEATESPAETEEREKNDGWISFIGDKLRNAGFVVVGSTLVCLGFWLLLKDTKEEDNE